MCRLAIFDLDNTLIDRTEMFRRWAAQFLAAHDLPAAELEWLQAQDGDGVVPEGEFFNGVVSVRDRGERCDPVLSERDDWSAATIAAFAIDPVVVVSSCPSRRCEQ
jgi:phosphoglycolate phosphatase-like HAD superfamily hydrolase